MKEKHAIERIYISFYNLRSFKSDRIRYKHISRERLKDIENFLYDVLPDIKELNIYDGKGHTYKNSKDWALRGIEIEFAKPLMKTYTEEFHEIYLPIDDFLSMKGKETEENWKDRHYIYNMIGHRPDFSPWQMDGRHMNLDRK